MRAVEARLSDAELHPVDDRIPSWPGRFVDLGHARVHVRTTPGRRSDAAPALFVHGLAGSSLNWTDLAAVLRGQLSAESIDLLGHGHSGPAPDGDYSIEAHIATVVEYLERTGRGPVHLVGNSMGGAICAHVAARRPDLVRTLTLISPALPDRRLRAYPLRDSPRLVLLAVPGLGEAILGALSRRVPPEQRLAGVLDMCFADPARCPRQRIREAADELRARDRLPWADAAVLRSMRGLAVSQYLHARAGWAMLRRITVPTLVVWGETDRLVAPDLAEHVAASVPGSRLLWLSDVGHVPMMEVPEITARAVLGLVEDTTDR